MYGRLFRFPDSGLRLNFKTDRTDAASSLLIAGLEFPVNIGFRLKIDSKSLEPPEWRGFITDINKEADYVDYGQWLTVYFTSMEHVDILDLFEI